MLPTPPTWWFSLSGILQSGLITDIVCRSLLLEYCGLLSNPESPKQKYRSCITQWHLQMYHSQGKVLVMLNGLGSESRTLDFFCLSLHIHYQYILMEMKLFHLTQIMCWRPILTLILHSHFAQIQGFGSSTFNSNQNLIKS